MRQSAFTILAPITAGELGDLERLLNEIGDDIRGNPHLRFGTLEGLHYASLFVFADGADDACLVFEGNVDGPTDAFLQYLVDHAGDAVDTIFRHCAGYPPPGARPAVQRWLQAHDIGTTTFYVAWPGRTVGDVRREQQLRDHIERFLDEQEGAALRQRPPADLHRSIGASLPAELDWARTPAPTPFLVAHGQKVLNGVLASLAVALLKLVTAALGRSSPRARSRLARLATLTLAGLLAGAAARLRGEEGDDERRDAQRASDWQTTYAQWTETEDLNGIVSREDRQSQNHMVSVTRVKEGWFRLAALRLVLRIISLVARLTANKGSLGGISSIHFARWVITPDGRHLIFLSNFDGSWESYLNDFIDLAASGLTAVWTHTDNAVGFPRTRWLVREGARDEARFKAYARFSMVPTNVWYSAYPDISVANIDNNMRIRADLVAPLDRSATEAWLRRL
ncbi:MAG: hypothetical protein H0V52_01885 [Acidimicrobiia bacterium]|nr:hypothetical protein [Acidimicrobiia bacterium]